MTIIISSIVSGMAGMFGWGVYDFLGGVFAQQIGSFKALFWSQLAGLLATVLLVFVFEITLDIPVVVVVLLPLAAVFYAAGYLLFFKGFELGKVSIIAATMNLWAVFTMLFAFVFMGQRLSLLQTAGVLLIIAGVALASLNGSASRQQKFRFASGVKHAIAGAFFFGVFWNMSEIIAERIGWLRTTLLVKLGIVVFLFIYSVLVRQAIDLTKAARKTKLLVLLMGMIEAGAVAAVNYGLTIGDAILISPIASALSLVTITLAVVFLKEKLAKLQVLGLSMAVVGIIATAL